MSFKGTEVLGEMNSSLTHPNAAELFYRCFTVKPNNDPRLTEKAIKRKDVEYLVNPSQSPTLGSTELHFIEKQNYTQKDEQTKRALAKTSHHKGGFI